MKNSHLIKAAERFGTPLYVYDTQKIQQQFYRLKNAFNSIERLEIRYAVKALSNLNILNILKKCGSGLDTVSIEEIKLGLHAGFDPKKIIFTPNGVCFTELEEAVRLGVQINIDNLNVLEKFGNIYPEVPVCLRINPHIMAGGNTNISVGHIDSKFGISIHQLPHILRIVANTKMNINGLHMHTGSDILDIGVFLRAAEILFDTARHFKNLSFLDFGSGFKVAYGPNDIETDIENLGEQLSKRFMDFCESYGKKLALTFEPGKFLVSEAGYFVVKTNAIKQTTSTVFAQVDSGFNHLIRPMLYGAKHEIINISQPKNHKRFYSVVGYICETDTFANNQQISEINEGDYLAFKNAGAYCFSMASNYNSRLRPAEVMLYKEELFLIREREKFEDLIDKQLLQPLPES
ncbi:diaminopimelate decarboxylase [Mesonia sp. HuA40]|uniref:diaminopimelate decarboxylase n=1 Tax=Mesonia sp. HuA40 TaxID=2602761 RepID=UPI0011C9876D|nr:diaminopimelate decarboxylase [Mesonia sp. HuA40]TXK71057.1 diaminopimelate decarboxylase [Mesonia sp. HuA40]